MSWTDVTGDTNTWIDEEGRLYVERDYVDEGYFDDGENTWEDQSAGNNTWVTI